MKLPRGYRLVPEEPSVEMIKAMASQFGVFVGGALAYAQAYRAAISLTPLHCTCEPGSLQLCPYCQMQDDLLKDQITDSYRLSAISDYGLLLRAEDVLKGGTWRRTWHVNHNGIDQSAPSLREAIDKAIIWNRQYN